mgnify:CR=1 FL=1
MRFVKEVNTMLDNKISIPVVQFETLIKAQTQLDIVKRYLERCESVYIDTSFLRDALETVPQEENTKDV